MRYWCDYGNLGYDQIQRWNIWEGGECDCSSLVIHALNEAGFDTGDAYYTGNLSANLTARGWARLSPDISSARVGDILLSDANHVAAVVYGWGWWATIAEAWLDENGGIYYGQTGDQTGLETRTRGIYSFPWDCILRYEGDDMEPVDVWAYTNPSESIDAYQALMETHRAVTGGGISSWAYMNPSETIDAYKALMDVHAWTGKLLELGGIPLDGEPFDYDKLAEAVADKLAKRMAD